VTFFALATAVALVVKKPWLDRVVIVLSSLPIALIANVIRITATGVLYQTVGKEWGEIVYHDLAGWLMVPLALGMLAAEVWLLSRLLVPRPAEAPPAPLPGLARGGAALLRRPVKSPAR
jgi:exosortase/archaeosortase family protein